MVGRFCGEAKPSPNRSGYPPEPPVHQGAEGGSASRWGDLEGVVVPYPCGFVTHLPPALLCYPLG